MEEFIITKLTTVLISIFIFIIVISNSHTMQSLIFSIKKNRIVIRKKIVHTRKTKMINQKERCRIRKLYSRKKEKAKGKGKGSAILGVAHYIYAFPSAYYANRIYA